MEEVVDKDGGKETEGEDVKTEFDPIVVEAIIEVDEYSVDELILLELLRRRLVEVKDGEAEDEEEEEERKKVDDDCNNDEIVDETVDEIAVEVTG